MHAAMLFVITSLPILLVLAFFTVRAANQRSLGAHPRDAVGPQTPVRTGSLSTSGRPRWWWLGLAATLLPIATTAALLKTRWDTIPARFPIHWGIDGQPNGWAARSESNVFGPLLFAVLFIAGFTLMGELIARSSPGHAGRATVIHTARELLLACAWFITALFCAVGLLPLVSNPTHLVPFLVIGSVVFSLVLVARVIYRQLQLGSAITAGQNSTGLQHWKAGLIYFNPNDSALMVPKQEGFGYTLNFGRPISWLILAAILALPLALPLFLHFHGR